MPGSAVRWSEPALFCSCGCGRALPAQSGRGRERRFATDACRTAALRDRERRELAIRAREHLLALGEGAALRLLAGLPTSALVHLSGESVSARTER